MHMFRIKVHFVRVEPAADILRSLTCVGKQRRGANTSVGSSSGQVFGLEGDSCLTCRPGAGWTAGYFVWGES